ILLLLGMTTKAQFYIGSGENIHVVNGGLLYTNDNVSGTGSINVNLSTTEAKGSISGVTINAINGTMKMSGSADQVVNGARFVDNAINRLFNHNTTSITIDGKVIVSDTLFMSTTGTPVVKMPNGDTLLLAAVVANGGEFQINGGVLHLNPNALDYACTTKIIGDSGVFSTVNIIENRDVTFGTFDLVSVSTFNLETVNNHIIRFANSSAVSWAGTQLTINGWQGAYDGTSGTIGKIYFGSSAAALTAAQLEKIRFYDGTYYYDATLLSTGELVPAANTIATGVVSTSICLTGASATSIPFTYSNAESFGSTTTFSAQLSDASGSFAAPTILATVVGDASGSQTISYTFSSETAGTGYRVRVVSDAPGINGSDNGSNIELVEPVVPSVTLSTTDDLLVCPAGAVASMENTINMTATPTNGGSNPTYQYWIMGAPMGDGNPVFGPNIFVGNEQIYVKMFPDNFCQTADSVVSNILVTIPLPMQNYYSDMDNDGYGNLNAVQPNCSLTTGYVLNSTDCNDNDATVNSGSTETCNGVDDDCDGTIDNGVLNTYFADADADTYGDLAVSTTACTAPVGYVTDGTDCDDTDNTVYPGATETCNTIDDDCDGTTDEGVQTTYYADADNDTYGDLTVTSDACSTPVGYVTNSTDCDDTDNAVYPGATETCNTIDDDCDGTADEGVQTTYYADADNDTYGDLAVTSAACSVPSGYVTNSTDCDDTDNTVYPGATETCNTIDDDCDGTIDEGVQNTYYADADNDTYGDLATTTAACSAPTGYVANSTDCNDASATVYPGATETCNTIDDDCDGTTDEGVQTTFYADADNDTYGDLATTTAACTAPSGYVANSTDCNDASASVHPGATETCNSIDDDCDGSTDEGVQTTYYADADNDTYGDLATTTTACTAPSGYVANSTDCDDTNNAINPTATETCNTIDDNCDGTTDEGVTTTYYEDNDNDTYGSSTSTVQACSLPVGYVTNNTDCNDNNGSVNPAATELCGNNIDEDCSGSDLVCPDGGPGSALLLANIGFYGATSPSISVNLPVGTNSVENPGDGQDRWFKFVAQYNAIRVALTGSNAVTDDNDINLFNDPTQLGVQLIPVSSENAVSTVATGAALDAGSETLIFDQLVPGQTYYICVRNNNSAPGVCAMICQYLRGSSSDISIVTSNTNTFSNSCQNFKSVYRFGASSYSIKRWTGASATGEAEFTYANSTQVGGVTSSFCQLGKFVAANLTNAPIQYTTKVDVVYNLMDAFGNAEVAVGDGTIASTFTMAPEMDLNVRTTDRCPVYKSASAGSIATNRSICGTSRYEWEFTQTLPTPSLPVYELGAVGGSRIMMMSQVDGILGGQTYGVKIRSKHFDGASNTAYGTSACVRTLGTAGLPTTDEESSEISNNGMKAVLYPNPNAGQGFRLNVEGMDGDVVVNVTDATGKLVKAMRYVAEGGFTAEVEFAQALASGLYQVEIMNGTSRHTMRMAVNR
ncbi:MAG: hypothetical protein RL521_1654, partial [Bacteroidota bacterium]